jgi:heme oxygenase (biliverdin-IX-beta and delta-forming)
VKIAEYGNALADDGVLAHVRRATRSAHQAIEGSSGLMEANLTAEIYRNVLQRFYSFWMVWEPQIGSLIQDEAFLAPRRRSHLLIADLAGLGVTEHMLIDLPLCPPTDLPDEMSALGSLYVMEGSTLGGRVILRNVEHCLGSEVRASSSYFRGYGAKSGPMWQLFLARLEQAPIASKQQIADGALATFSNLGRWLSHDDL